MCHALVYAMPDVPRRLCHARRAVPSGVLYACSAVPVSGVLSLVEWRRLIGRKADAEAEVMGRQLGLLGT